MQTVLAQRVVSAAWRLARADEIEAGVLREQRYSDGGLGLAVVRDCNGARAFPTLLRYRGAALAEFLRCLRLLQALQAEARTIEAPAGPRRHARSEPSPFTPPARIAARPAPAGPEPRRDPDGPNALADPRESAPESALTPISAPARARPSQPEPAPATSLAGLQRDLDERCRPPSARACG